MPDAPAGAGAPVFSVWQTDVIFYGANLLDCLRHELAPETYVHEAADVRADSSVPWSLFAFGEDVTH